MIFLPLILLWLLGFLCLSRFELCLAGDTPARRPSVSIIIPARNEAGNLPRLLDSLRGQDCQPLDIIVVDDNSSDGTDGIAADRGARVVQAGALPEGWLGKPWACRQGAQAASGKLLLFIDADTWFEPGGLGRMVDAYVRTGGALAVSPYHAVSRIYEQLSVFFNLMMVAGVGAFTVLAGKLHPTGLFGQCLLVHRDDYARVGGHDNVRDCILENMSLAPLFSKQGIRPHCCVGKSTLSFRMYPGGLMEMTAGWSKSAAGGAARTPPWLLLLLTAWITGAIFAVVGVVLALSCNPGGLALAAWLGIYALYVAQIWWFLRHIGRFSWWTSLCYPLPLAFYLGVFAWSAAVRCAGGHATWKGRTVEIKEGHDSC